MLPRDLQMILPLAALEVIDADARAVAVLLGGLCQDDKLATALSLLHLEGLQRFLRNPLRVLGACVASRLVGEMLMNDGCSLDEYLLDVVDPQAQVEAALVGIRNLQYAIESAKAADFRLSKEEVEQVNTFVGATQLQG